MYEKTERCDEELGKIVILQAKNKRKGMTAVQLRAELFREMSPLLDNETAMMKMIAFLKKLVIVQTKQTNTTTREGWAAAAKQAHADGEDKLMIDEVFADEALEDWRW